MQLVKNIKNEFDSLHGDYKKIIQEEVNLEELDKDEVDAKNIDFDYHDIYVKKIRNPNAIEELDKILEDWNKLKSDNKDLFYYFDGIKGTAISKGQHPSGMIGSPITLCDNLAVHYKDGNKEFPISSCAMKAVDSLNFVKFDILGLKTLGIIKDAEKYANIKHKKAYEIDWNDKKVWRNMMESQVGIFQFEGDYAFSLLKSFEPKTITHMSIINAALRPSGKSYRDKLISKEFNKNPSEVIDKLLEDNNGYLVFQEDTIKFLQNICGFDGGTADIIRRCIGKKDHETLQSYLPKILDGYCDYSDKPRKVAEEEAKEFIQIISDSSEYQFGYNHSTGYSMNGYRCVRLREYHPLEFTTAYLNRAKTDDDMLNGTKLAKQYDFTINPIQFRYSTSEYNLDRSNNSIYKGVMAIKGLGKTAGDELYSVKDKKYETFTETLLDIINNTSVNQGKIRTLTKLDFFSEFGKSKKLLKVLDMFFGDEKKELYSANQYSKKTASLLKLHFDEDIIAKYSTKKTNKQYSGVDYMKVISESEKNLIDEDSDIKDKIEWQLEYLSYLNIIHGEDKRRCVVTKLKETQWNSLVTLYCLANGKSQVFKLKNKDKIESFKEKEIMLVKSCEEKYRVTPRRDENGDIIRNSKGRPKHYDKTDKLEWVLNSYTMEVF